MKIDSLEGNCFTTLVDEVTCFLVLSSQSQVICKENGGQGLRGREPSLSFKLEDVTLKSLISEEDFFLTVSKILSQNFYFPQKNNMGVFGNITVFSSHVLILQICLEKSKLCLTFTQHVWKKTNTLVYLHLGAFFHTCLDFDTYVWEKAHMCDKNHTII